MMKSSSKHYLIILAFAFAFFNQSFSTDETKRRTELPMHKGTLKTIYSSNGEIVDCVDYYQQPAFDHPLLKDRKHEFSPEIPDWLKNMKTESMGINASTFQTWRQSGECPQGTVPILRQPDIDQDIIRKMKRHRMAKLNLSDEDVVATNEFPKHEYAVVEVQRGRYYYGGTALFNLWKPFIERDKEFSLAQLWFVKGYGRTLETIEAGWHVYPQLYTDFKKEPRLFIYWTADNYIETGCYNLQCKGFVSSSSNIIPGARTLTSSISGGKQSVMDVTILRDQNTGNWWLRALGEVIGHWPASLFRGMNDHADLVQWGGEVINYDPKTHTSTEMGSGHFPSEGFGKAAFFHTLKIIKEPEGNLVDPPELFPLVTNAACYDLKINPNGNPLPGLSFFYGGLGFSETCKTS